MPKYKNYHDTISEEEFTTQVQGASTDPQEDSPGDSEKDAGVEFAMGVNYKPIASEFADEDETLQNEISAIERPNDLVLTPHELKFRVPTSAMVKSSEQPAPWEDKDRTSSSN
jgi:hypothetical protein